MPAPIDVQVSGTDLDEANQAARKLAARIRELPAVGEAYIPQDMNYPALRLNVDRVHASELGLNPENIPQRHYGARLEHHDRAQLLGGS